MNQPETKRNMIELEVEKQGDEIFEFTPAEEQSPPSWFAQTYHDAKPDDLANRYRERLNNEVLPDVSQAQEAYRRRIEERFQSAKAMAEQQVPSAMPKLPGHEAPPARKPIASKAHDPSHDEGLTRFREWDQKVHGTKLEKPRSARLPGKSAKIAASIAFACLLGGGAGYVSAHPDSVAKLINASSVRVQAAVAALMAPQSPKAEPQSVAAGMTAETVLTKKPVKIAKVSVSDASGALNDPIPLVLAAIPADPSQPVSLRITGLPADAYLTQGTEISKGQWIVKPHEFAGVELVVPTSTSSQLDLAVSAIEEKTGTVAAPAQELTVDLDMQAIEVMPVNAGPEPQTAAKTVLPEAVPLPLEVENGEGRNLVSKGDTILKTGDVISARQFYLKAHELGLTEAAFGVGQTYDPVVFKDLKVRGLQPDRAKAEEWYAKAAKTGFAPAQDALTKMQAAK